MDDFVELGLEGAHKIIDKHFHRVPDKVLHPDTYKHPRATIKKLRTRERPSSAQSEPVDIEVVEDPMMENSGRPRDDANSSPYLQDGPFVQPPLQYSNELPRHRQRYEPVNAPVGVAGGYYPPPSIEDSPRRNRKSTYDDDYYPPPRRPGAMRRRSSSYHGPRRDYDHFDDDDRQLVHRPRRRDSASDMGSKMKDNAHRYGLKDEVARQFTKSKDGLIGGAVGAVLGGWAAHKAQEARGRDRQHEKEGTALTLLGAAVGGLAVNTVIDKWEDKKLETEDKQEKWEDKWGSEDERDRRSGRRSRDGRRERREQLW
jgi:hypothetical protein